MDHAWEGTTEYADTSGFMGYSYAEDDGPKMCFNAAKSWQLGWYADKAFTVDPSVTSSWDGTLVGISDYNDAGNNHVLVKLETGAALDYYMNFNRATGINSGTKEGENQVLITSQGANGEDFSKSTLLAKLSAGQSFDITGSVGFYNYIFQVSVTTIDLFATPAYAHVSVTSAVEQAESVFINCGGSLFNDGTNIWQPDEDYVNTGRVDSTTAPISNTESRHPLSDRSIRSSQAFQHDLQHSASSRCL